ETQLGVGRERAQQGRGRRRPAGPQRLAATRGGGSPRVAAKRGRKWGSLSAGGAPFGPPRPHFPLWALWHSRHEAPSFFKVVTAALLSFLSAAFFSAVTFVLYWLVSFDHDPFSPLGGGAFPRAGPRATSCLGLLLPSGQSGASWPTSSRICARMLSPPLWALVMIILTDGGLSPFFLSSSAAVVRPTDAPSSRAVSTARPHSRFIDHSSPCDTNA